MAQMFKIALALPQQLVSAMAVIEQDTDRPRTRIIRRAVSDYIRMYAAEHPGFMERVGGPIEVERELKPGLKLDTISVNGKRQEVIVTDNGWRLPTPDDYVEEMRNLKSILDAQD